jgi:hypothetical protein
MGMDKPVDDPFQGFQRASTWHRLMAYKKKGHDILPNFLRLLQLLHPATTDSKIELFSVGKKPPCSGVQTNSTSSITKLRFVLDGKETILSTPATLFPSCPLWSFRDPDNLSLLHHVRKLKYQRSKLTTRAMLNKKHLHLRQEKRTYFISQLACQHQGGPPELPLPCACESLFAVARYKQALHLSGAPLQQMRAWMKEWVTYLVHLLH